MTEEVRQKAGSIPRLAVYMQFPGGGRGAGAEPRIPFGFRYVVECPSCVQWMSDNGEDYVLSSSLLSARCIYAGGQGCQGDRGIPEPDAFPGEDMPRKPLDSRRTGQAFCHAVGVGPSIPKSRAVAAHAHPACPF